MTRPASDIPATKQSPAQFSKKLDAQLFAYVAAASAAGVTLLAQSAEAKIVYTQADITIGVNQRVSLDLNNDGTPDFILSFGFNDFIRPPEGGFSSIIAITPAKAANEVWGVLSAKGWECAAALPPGAQVGPGAPFKTGYLPMVAVAGSYTRGASEHCPWGEQHRGAFLGLKFVINGLTHYGWAHVTDGNSLVVNGYAYETVPNQPIATGKTSGPVAELDLPIAPPAQPATLGMLAQGSRGLSIWRREEDQR